MITSNCANIVKRTDGLIKRRKLSDQNNNKTQNEYSCEKGASKLESCRPVL